MRIVKLNAETKKDLLKNLLKRSPSNFGNYAETVQGIVDDVRDNGDAALFSYTKKFDKADITAANVKVTQAEIDYAYTQVSPELLEVIRKAKNNIWEYHEKQKQYSWFDSKRNTSRTEGHSTGIGWCVCTWWKSCISFISSYECNAC